ncbi:MAG: hypothetical protein ACC661_02965 [Verrucomicrobiales bacterium]
MTTTNLSTPPRKILYCRCAYAKVVPEDVKDDVLRELCASGQPFETVSDLCEMSAAGDSRLDTIARESAENGLRIAACFPRAVRWLFHAADSPLPEGEAVEILNMRERSATEVADGLLHRKREEVQEVEAD